LPRGGEEAGVLQGHGHKIGIGDMGFYVLKSVSEV